MKSEEQNDESFKMSSLGEMSLNLLEDQASYHAGRLAAARKYLIENDARIAGTEQASKEERQHITTLYIHIGQAEDFLRALGGGRPL